MSNSTHQVRQQNLEGFVPWVGARGAAELHISITTGSQLIRELFRSRLFVGVSLAGDSSLCGGFRLRCKSRVKPHAAFGPTLEVLVQEMVAFNEELETHKKRPRDW